MKPFPKRSLLLALAALSTLLGSASAEPSEIDLKKHLALHGGETMEYSMAKAALTEETTRRWLKLIDRIIPAVKNSTLIQDETVRDFFQTQEMPENPIRHFLTWLGIEDLAITGYRTYTHPTEAQGYQTQFSTLAKTDRPDGAMWTMFEGECHAERLLGLAHDDGFVSFYARINPDKAWAELDTLLQAYGQSTAQLRQKIFAPKGKDTLSPDTLAFMALVNGEIFVSVRGFDDEQSELNALVAVGVKQGTTMKDIKGAILQGKTKPTLGEFAGIPILFEEKEANGPAMTLVDNWLLICSNRDGVSRLAKKLKKPTVPKYIKPIAPLVDTDTIFAAAVSTDFVEQIADEDPDGQLAGWIEHTKNAYTLSLVCRMGAGKADLFLNHQIPLNLAQRPQATTTVAITGLMAAILVPAVTGALDRAEEVKTRQILRHIDHAKEMHAIQHGLAPGAIATEKDLKKYFPNGIPLSLDGEAYSINPIGTPASRAAIERSAPVQRAH